MIPELGEKGKRGGKEEAKEKGGWQREEKARVERGDSSSKGTRAPSIS